MTIKEFEATLPREAFREIKVLGYWAYTQVLDVNKLGRVRVVICSSTGSIRWPTKYQSKKY